MVTIVVLLVALVITPAVAETLVVKPDALFATATLSNVIVARGDDLTITGTAQGSPSSVRIWIFGPNYQKYGIPVQVGSDGSFRYVLTSAETSGLTEGQYYVIVQHPGSDGFDLTADGTMMRAPGVNPVDLSQLQAPDAANTLINAFESSSVYDTYTKLTFLVDAPAPVTGSLDIRSTPSGASVYVDDSYKGVTPLEISEVSAGSHQIKITKSGYSSYTQTTSVTAGTTTPITATLTANLPTPTPTSAPSSGGAGTSSGSLDVRSTPSGASIYIDDAYKGVTPKVVSGLSTGPHHVKMIRDGYYDYSLTTTVTAGKTTTVLATLTSLPSTPTPTPTPKTTTGSLDVRSTPSGASIYIDGTYKGVTPNVVSGLSAGSHQVKVTQNGYRDDTQTIIVTVGKTTTVSATLSAAVVAASAASVTGSLSVESDPAGAEIYIDGEYNGVTPKVISGLSEGECWVTVTKDGYVENIQHKYISAGSTSRVLVTLSPILTNPTEPLPTAIPSGPLSAVDIPVTWWLLAIAVVLPAGGLIYARKRRSAQTSGTKAGEDRLSTSPVDHVSGQQGKTTNTTSHHPRQAPPQDVTSIQGRADVSAQNSSDLSPNKPDPGVVLPDRGSTALTAKPDLTITLSHTSIHADEWDKIGLTLVNTGTTAAFGITLTFSNDVETRLIRPVDLEAGKSITIEAGIKPRTKGKIPLEIIARYRDAERKAYEQTTSCWLSVEARNDAVTHSSPVPSSISRPVTPKSLPPEMAERYTAAEFLGRGGFARVFKVQKPDGSWAALKIPISLDAATGKSFIAELQNWTSLVHENIVRVNDYNIMPLPYFELELCDGTLADLKKPVSPDHAAWLLFNVCEGLKYAHARGVLHRDLKPQNIMLRDGVPKITDWGLSKVMTQSRTTTVSGGFTAYYAAPEQIANKAKGPRTDIWQLGVILYELATGTLPFTGESMVEIGMAIVTKTPERPGAVYPEAEPLDAIILKCLEKQPKQRYQSVVDLQKDLAAYLKMNCADSLKESVQANNLQRSAYYCGDLILISIKIGDLVAAYKYAVDLARYSAGETQTQAVELAKQIKMRVELGAQELPAELVQKAEVIVHHVRVR